ncbi:OLC1v1038158C1 [Oldenlandia corymbosa var. corymbosa]|uniref:OLC1v1038158C1 n=1 Tax=Oldenlandia corymbosa var. corymbosa TaxID=529605 RepID=A0AAV1D058_OLDCO|nr:OLC1v1038158C1 [Oldenlandia corymbosa var. corymbosa]
MCGRKWGKDARCRSVLLRIELIVGEQAQKFESTALRLRDDQVASDLKWLLLDKGISKFLACIQQSLLQEMEELYLVFLDGSSQTGPSSPEEVNLLVGIAESLLHNLQDLLQQENYCAAPLVAVEDLKENVRFLKNFLLFAMFGGLEHWQMEELLTHFGDLLLNAAHLTFMSRYYYYRKMWYYIYQLIERIQPLDSRTGEIYVRVLQALKFSLSSHHPAPGDNKLLLRDFVDSLLTLLGGLLVVGTSCTVNIFNHQMQKLHDELTSLSTILKETQSKFDELYDKIHGLVGIVICEAATTICYLFAKRDEGGLLNTLELLFSDLEEKFKRIKAEMEAHKYSVTIASHFPQSNVLEFIDSVVEKFGPCQADSVALEKDKLKTLQNALIFLRSFLEDVMEHCNQNEKLQALRTRIVDIANETDSVLDSILAGDANQSLVMRLDTITEDINLIRTEASESFNKMLSAGEIMVGLDDEARKIIDGLKRGGKLLDIVSVVGMAGLGKTTLAKKVYRDPAITHHFSARSWCRVSQVYSKRSLLLEILNNFDKFNDDKLSEMDEDDLAIKLYRHLKGKRYLVVLDDVWDIAVWNSLLNSFPTDANESRILVTSRDHGVAKKIKPDRKPHRLRWLNDDESWKLMQKKICYEEDRPESVLALGREIAQLCKGLPLTVLIVSGILANTKADTWMEVAESLRRGKLSFIEQCKKTLNLSYSHLPKDLKPCFLYLGAYQEYVKVPVRNLLWLWAAEGLVKITDRECLEDVAEGYVMELVRRSLVMVAEKRSSGRVKSFILHDLLRDFCQAKGKEANFLHSLNAYQLGTSIEPSILYRSRLYPRREGLLESRLLCSRLRNLFVVSENEKWYRRHRFNVLYKLCQSKDLRVLDLRRINLGPFFPRVVELHVNLKYLALALSIQGEILAMPSSISNLSNLETFIIEGSRLRVSLPYTMWDMKNLRQLCISESACWELPKENPEDCSDLGNLETLSTVVFPCSHTMEAVVKKFPNIRRLKCNLIQTGACIGSCKTLSLDEMSQLESLTLSQVHQEFHDLHFQFPLNIKKLVLSGLCMPWNKISAIDELPYLEVLKLLNNAFTGEVWDMEEGKFPELKYLKLADLELVSWTGTESDDNFPCLQKLVLERCRCLKEVPLCLAHIPDLAMIEVSKCENATSSIKQIKEKQMELTGDELLKILIHHS